MAFFTFAIVFLFLPTFYAQEWDHENCTNSGCDVECWYHGKCIYGHSCKCDYGWYGDNCEHPECSENNQCKFGNCCGEKRDRCCCYKGWRGEKCNQFFGGYPFSKSICNADGECYCGSNASIACNDAPDLAVSRLNDKTPYIEYKKFGGCDCAVGNCINRPGKRKLLRFDFVIQNIGTADMFLGYPRSQREYYEWDICRSQMHLHYFISFQLVDSESGRIYYSSTRSSTLKDDTKIRNFDSAFPHRKFHPTYQGLQVGWEDQYPSYLDCNWIDITDMSSRNFTLVIKVNAQNTLYESNYSNNELRVPLICEDDCNHGRCDFGSRCICNQNWTGEKCNIYTTGEVQCIPKCSGKSCGDDHCGGNCGHCERHEHCNDDSGTCQCTPNCNNKECGDDGCGGECGICRQGNDMCYYGMCWCEPTCAGKQMGDWDGCDDIC